MLSSKQIAILTDFYHNPDTYIRLREISEKYHISIRTAQSHISAIRDFIKDSGMSLESVASKGCILHITNPDKSAAFLQKIANAPTSGLANDQSFRVSSLLSRLLSANEYIKSQDLADEMFISRSRLSDDIVLLKKILGEYNLSLISKPYHGLKITGKESNVRQCLIREAMHLYCNETDPGNQAMLLRIRQIVTPVLSEMHYHTSDASLKSLLIHILLAVKRIQNGCIVETMSLPDNFLYADVYKIAHRIMSLCCSNFHIPYHESEIIFLAVNLQGKREYDDRVHLPANVLELIQEGLNKIKADYNIDFTKNSELQTALGLHMIPLFSRLHMNMPVKNILSNEIKLNYTLAFEIASSFLSILPDSYQQLSDDEIAYFALHFSYALLNQNRQENNKRVLLIGAQRKSTLILLCQKIRQWFVEIEDISILSENEVSPELLEDYDIILCTDPEISAKYPSAKQINYFLTEQDYKKIELALSGFHSLQDILDNFDRDLFYYGSAKDKYDIIRILYEKADRKYHLGEEFLQSLTEHERNANSQFNEFLAIPHPEKPMTSHTFIAVGILKNEIQWSEDFQVRLVLLVSIGKNNPKALQLWYYLSPLISDKDALLKIIQNPSYENLIKTIKTVYRDLF